MTLPQLSAQPTFRAATDYVRIHVAVTDKHDTPIRSLTRDDFEIIEQGRTQMIDDFEFVGIPVGHQPGGIRQPSPSSDVATNTAPSPRSRAFVMVVDDLHITESEVPHVQQLIAMFERALAPDDDAAVVFTGHSNLGQMLTTDRAPLLKAIDQVRGAIGFGLDALGRTGSSNITSPDSTMQLALAREADFALKNVAQTLAGSEHSRRVIVYVSSGSVLSTTPIPTVPPTPTDYDYLREAYDAARRADVQIYTVDPRGQLAPEDTTRGGISGIGVIGGSAGQVLRATISANIQRQVDRLSEIAINTGGRAFTRQSNLARAVDEIFVDSGNYYVLGYYPSPFTADGKFHELKVHVRRSGAHVRARSGYLASSRRPAVADTKITLSTAMSARLNVSGISLRTFVAPMSPGQKGTSTLVAIQVMYPVQTEGPRQVEDDLEMSILAFDSDAKVKASSAHTFHFVGTAAPKSPVTFLVGDVVELPTQPLILRVGVASRALGKAGSVQSSLEIPNLSIARLQLSGVILGLSGQPREAVLQTTAIKDLLPFQPTTSRVFASTDTLRVYAHVFWRASDAAVSVTLSVPGAIQAQTRSLDASPSFGGLKEARLDAEFPFVGLSSGNHLLVIEAQLDSGQIARREVAFAVR